MTPDTIRQAAQTLIDARNRGTALEDLPEGCIPATDDDSRAIQEAMADLCGWPLAGYKIGCTTAAAREMLNTDRPFPGRVFRPFLFRSPAAVPAENFIRQGVEGEFAFELAADIPARPDPWTRREIAERVACLFPAIEIIDTRFTRFVEAGILRLTADTGANGGLVLGDAISDWQAVDLEDAEIVMSIEGAETGRGRGREALGHPLEALTWLANDLSRRGCGMLAGQVVTTGTCTGMQYVPDGGTATADFSGLGKVSVTFSA